MLRTQLKAGVLTVTLDRPAKRNALTLAMRQELELLPERCAADPDIRCVVLTGAGGCFSAGADLREIAELSSIAPTNPASGLADLDLPTIAAVDGLCVTGGLEIALACDMIFASPTARFADTHLKMGVVPRWGLSVRLPRRIGAARAAEMSLTGRWVDADEAAAWGLANRVIPEDFEGEVFRVASQVAQHDDAATRATVALLRRSLRQTEQAALADEQHFSRGFGF